MHESPPAVVDEELLRGFLHRLRKDYEPLYVSVFTRNPILSRIPQVPLFVALGGLMYVLFALTALLLGIETPFKLKLALALASSIVTASLILSGNAYRQTVQTLGRIARIIRTIGRIA